MKKPVLKEDLLNYNFLSQISCSPFEDVAIFTVTKAQKNGSGYKKNLWMMDLQTKKSVQITKSNSSKKFYFLEKNILLNQCKPKDRNDYHTGFEYLNLATLKAEYAFTIPYPVNSMHKIDRDNYIVNANVNTNRNENMSKAELAAESDYIPVKELPFWDNGIGFVSGWRDSLFIFNAKTEKIEPITDKLFNVGNVAITPDNSCVYFSGQHYDEKMSSKNGLYCYEIGKNRLTTIVNQDEMRVRQLEYINDRLFVSATFADKFQNIDKDDWYILENDRLIKILDNDYTIGCNVSTDCRYGGSKATGNYLNSLLYLTTEGKKCGVNLLNKFGKTEKPFDFDGAIDGVSVWGDKIIFTGMEKGKLQEIYLFDGEKVEKISDFNGKALNNKYVGEVKYAGFTNSDGILIDGWIIEPINYDPNKKYPALMSMHGGPCVAWGELFVHEMQMFAGEGYFVYLCNPRGSDGRGAEFADLRGKYGDIDFSDFMEFTDHVLEMYSQIDKKKLGALGGSYGGFMANWIVGNTDRFSAIVSQRSFCNPISDFGNSCIGYSFDTEQFQGTPWTNTEEVWAHSPLKYAPNAKTPTLFIHSIEDYNCPLSQGLEMFSALKYHGVTCEMLLFKGENHELSRSGMPLHRMRRLSAMADWFEKYTK